MGPTSQKTQNPVPIIVGAVVSVGALFAIMFAFLDQPMLSYAALALIPVGLLLGYVLPNAGLGEPIFKKKRK